MSADTRPRPYVEIMHAGLSDVLQWAESDDPNFKAVGQAILARLGTDDLHFAPDDSPPLPEVEKDQPIILGGGYAVEPRQGELTGAGFTDVTIDYSITLPPPGDE